MKLEIEITEDEIRSAVGRKVRTAVADQTNQWGVDNYIKDKIKAEWKSVVDALVHEELSNSDKLRDKIAKSIEDKLKGQLNALLKVKK